VTQIVDRPRIRLRHADTASSCVSACAVFRYGIGAYRPRGRPSVRDRRPWHAYKRRRDAQFRLNRGAGNQALVADIPSHCVERRYSASTNGPEHSEGRIARADFGVHLRLQAVPLGDCLRGVGQVMWQMGRYHWMAVHVGDGNPLRQRACSHPLIEDRILFNRVFDDQIDPFSIEKAHCPENRPLGAVSVRRRRGHPFRRNTLDIFQLDGIPPYPPDRNMAMRGGRGREPGGRSVVGSGPDWPDSLRHPARGLCWSLRGAGSWRRRDRSGGAAAR
jgi:hypothetical protein